jgi:hypothetical protein
MKGVRFMRRRLALLLGLLISVVVLLPFATSTAHNLRSQYYGRSHRFHHHHHSRRWWRHHRALMRRRQAAIARRRALQAALRNNTVPGSDAKSANHVAFPNALALPDSLYRDGSFAMPLPDSWSTASANQAGSSFQIGRSSGAQASLAVVALAPPANAVQPLPSEQRKMLGGVAYTDLRRTVIDKMITAGGWVVNDRQREIGGHKVFEVIAQTPANNDTKSDQVWNFYFTEVDGRVYSLTTRSAVAATNKVAADAEQFITTLRPVEPKR